MKKTCLLSVLGFAISGQLGSRCLAENPAPTLESVLARWEEASQKCQSLDAKVTVLHYDVVFGPGDRPTITRGRFYYEAPNRGRYEIRKDGVGEPDGWSRVQEAMVWKGDQTLWIEGDRRLCRVISVAEWEKITKSQAATATPQYCPGIECAVGLVAGFWQRLLAPLSRAASGPKEFLPLVVDIHAGEVRERFSLTLEDRGEEILLKAVPKQPSRQVDYREIDVILNARSYMTRAIQLVSSGGKERFVFVFDDQKVNQRPSDRDELLKPDLQGLSVQQVGL